MEFSYPQAQGREDNEQSQKGHPTDHYPHNNHSALQADKVPGGLVGHTTQIATTSEKIRDIAREKEVRPQQTSQPGVGVQE